jgi:hypothetical protein
MVSCLFGWLVGRMLVGLLTGWLLGLLALADMDVFIRLVDLCLPVLFLFGCLVVGLLLGGLLVVWLFGWLVDC